MNMTKLPNQLTGRGYRQSAEYFGLPAYVIDKLVETGFFGRTRESVIEHITSDWVIHNLDKLSALGINIDEAKKEGYIPIKFKKSDQ
jgi:hypothetical protein